MPGINDRLREIGVEPTELDWEDTDELFENEQMTPTAHSSNVAAIRFDRKKGLLYVMFDNGREKAGPRLYVYFGFGGALETVYDDLFSAASPGGVVWDQLRRPGVGNERLS